MSLSSVFALVSAMSAAVLTELYSLLLVVLSKSGNLILIKKQNQIKFWKRLGI